MQEGLQKVVSTEETIVAISTPPGRSGIGIVRISGSQSLPIASRFFRSSTCFEPRIARTGSWVAENGDVIDEVVVTGFRGPRSYTGEDVVEISAHGNPFVLQRIMACAQSAGARVAVAGEFTLRAVVNGKMDLIQAEAVRDFIEAQTAHQARAALRHMEGALSKRIRPIKNDLVDLVAHLEAGIDFAEDDVEIPQNGNVAARLGSVREELERLQETFGYGGMLTRGLRLIILGRPNVGKSSLFNRFVCSERAIVTNTPGTTRDVVSETIDLAGIPTRISDTAGIRETQDVVESIGVGKTLEALVEMDMALVVIDGSDGFIHEDQRILERVHELPHIVVVNKSDLEPVASGSIPAGVRAIRVSAKTGAGLRQLQDAILEFIQHRRTDALSDSILTNSRQNDAVLRAIEKLNKGVHALSESVPHEMVLLDCYDALSALDELTGEVVNDDILAKIFSTFCIGK